MILFVASKISSSFCLFKSLTEMMFFPKNSFIYLTNMGGVIQTILMEETDLIVRRIKNGTVIDHIDGGKGLQVLDALDINAEKGDVITIALNVPSGKLKKKDIIKVENKFLEEDDTNKLAVISPLSTINIIKNYQLVEKRRVSLPNEIERIFRCSNPDCVTNSKEHIESVMDVIDKDGLVLKCRYCNRMLDVNLLRYS